MADQQQNGDVPRRRVNDESDVEEEAMVEDYREQVDYEDGMNADLDDGAYGGGPQDIQAQLAAAVTPLEYGASLDAKFASYDNYVSLFHYILNSDGPVDLELPSVYIFASRFFITILTRRNSTTGPGM